MIFQQLSREIKHEPVYICVLISKKKFTLGDNLLFPSVKYNGWNICQCSFTEVVRSIAVVIDNISTNAFEV